MLHILSLTHTKAAWRKRKIGHCVVDQVHPATRQRRRVVTGERDQERIVLAVLKLGGRARTHGLDHPLKCRRNSRGVPYKEGRTKKEEKG